MLGSLTSFSQTTNWNRFNPGPVFQKALRCRKRIIALEGAVGTGKSSIACLYLAWHCAENPGAIWLVVRRTYKMLKDNTLKSTWLTWFPDGEAGHLDGDENFHLDCEMFGKRAIGEIRFRPAERPEDIDRFMGGEYAGAWLDEVTGTYREGGGLPEDVYLGLNIRLRQPGMKRYHMLLAFNPPPPGHWIAKEFPLPERDTELSAHYRIPPKENEQNLPPDYYGALFKTLGAREDWIARFLNGERVPIGKANCVFDRQAILKALDDWVCEPVTRGVLKRDKSTGLVTLDPVPDAPLRIWERPNSGTVWICDDCLSAVPQERVPTEPKITQIDCPRCGVQLACRPHRHNFQDRYILGTDAGSGLSERDASCAMVMSRATGNHVAEWHGHLSPRAFAKEIAMLAWHYNEAFVVPEVEPSADGRSVCDALEQLGYGHIYQQRREQNIGDPVVRRLGLPMSRFNKTRIVGLGREWWTEKRGKIPNEALLLEILGFVQHADGKLAGDEGIADDRVMAWLCCLEGYQREGAFIPTRRDGEQEQAVLDMVERIHSGVGGSDSNWMAW